MRDVLQPGDRVLDLRAVARSGGMFAGLIVAPVAAWWSGWWWAWCAAAAIGVAAGGFAVAGVIARVLFRAPPGQLLVARVGPTALRAALWASVAGGFPVSLGCAVGAFIGAGGVPALVTLLVGIGVSGGVGCLAALL